MATSNSSKNGNTKKSYGSHQFHLHSCGSQLLICWFHGKKLFPPLFLNGFLFRKSLIFLLLLCNVQVLSLHETLVAFKSVYYIGTVIPIVVLLLSSLVPVKPVKPKTRKEE